ncbi:tetratricopeptide repeat protein [uncultured Vibrio sp.]|uniref:tetratricopeptide repeat protein n=1 Tax=uncultured Vibrio sp. TaxID=114054 RepID=UPI0025E523E0|nr:tetratricopeptide repeat protein [uncultured Vibrio sp.]
MKKLLSIAVSTLLVIPNAWANSVEMNAPQNALKTSEQSLSSSAERVSQLAYQAQDTRLSDEERASALRALGEQPSQNGLVAVSRGLKDESPLIREAAIIGADPYPLEYRWRLVSPLLVDDVKMVRITAASALLKDLDNLDRLPSVERQDKEALMAVSGELISHLSKQASHEATLLLADVYRWTKQYENAQDAYQALLKEMPENPQVWLSSADNYRAQGLDRDAVSLLDRAIKRLPANASLHFSKSLALVRLDQKEMAATESHLAATLANNNSYYWYINGVLQEGLDIDYSTQSFEQAYLLSGAPEHLYAVCDIYSRYHHAKTDQCLIELEKVAPPEVIAQLKEVASTN